jgi:Flp pilus assembly pilin Flp
MLTLIRRHFHSHHESGQTLTEYSLVVGLIAIAVAAALPFVGSAVAQLYAGAAELFGA